MSFQLPEAVAEALLFRLGHDDDYRLQFAHDTRAALASLGFEAAADSAVDRGVWMCLRVEELASKEVIRAAENELRMMLANRGVFYAFTLEAKTADRAA